MRSRSGEPDYALAVSELARLTGAGVAELRSRLRELGLVRQDSVPTSLAPRVVRDYLQGLGVGYEPQVIAAINLRGGVSKTTCAITTASRAAQYGFRTCLIDLDPQASASVAFGKIPAADEAVFYDVWQRPQQLLEGALRRIDEFLYILPSSLENGLLDVTLVNPTAQKGAMAAVCRELRAESFDLVVIDCPPSLGAGVISAVCAADRLVVPVWGDVLSFRGIELTMTEVRSICSTFGLEPPRVQLLFARLDRREKVSPDAWERLQAEYGDLVFPRPIRTSTEFSKSLMRARTVFASRKRFPARDDYDIFIRSLLGLDDLKARKVSDDG